ncbi:MAG: MOSC domain-containing protein [Fimbriimonadaceae bacterium]|nr:MOSC domain-containing protein [Alphaproteobacteria bacterium]
MSDQPGPHIAEIYHYPVKGLDGSRLDRTQLEPGNTIAWDRAFAILNGVADFDPDNPVFLPKTKFLNLARHEKLASLKSSFDPDTGLLTIFRTDKPVSRGNALERIGRQMLEQFFAAYMADELHAAPRILHGDHHSFSDVPAKCLSIINLASVRDLERVIGRPVDPRRFRGNLYVEGIAPWAELEWMNKEIACGEDVRLSGLQRIGRCAATNVDPDSAARDLNIPQTLIQSFGHSDCGIYVEVIKGGEIHTGQTITIGN